MADLNLMPIGRFARSCRLSVKALRHYDELGLLEPAFVDPQSRYRYYSRDQARQAVMIGMLRSLDLPLAVIRSSLRAGPDELKLVIDRETARIEAEVEARQLALLSLRHIAASGGLASYDVEVQQQPDRRVARISGQTDAAHLIPDTTELVYALFDELRSLGITYDEPVFTINEFNESRDDIAIHACVGVGNFGNELCRAEVVELPGGPSACLTHVGPYETLGIAHHALFAWAQERGHEPVGPIWEFYPNDPATVPPEALISDVALPLVANSETHSGETE